MRGAGASRTVVAGKRERRRGRTRARAACPEAPPPPEELELDAEASGTTEEEEEEEDDASLFDVCKQWCILMQYQAIVVGLGLVFCMQIVGMLVPPDFAQSNQAAQLRRGGYQLYATYFKGERFCPCEEEENSTTADPAAAAASADD
jgi:hypothetical protein